MSQSHHQNSGNSVHVSNERLGVAASVAVNIDTFHFPSSNEKFFPSGGILNLVIPPQSKARLTLSPGVTLSLSMASIVSNERNAKNNKFTPESYSLMYAHLPEESMTTDQVPPSEVLLCFAPQQYTITNLGLVWQGPQSFGLETVSASISIAGSIYQQQLQQHPSTVEMHPMVPYNTIQDDQNRVPSMEVMKSKCNPPGHAPKIINKRKLDAQALINELAEMQQEDTNAQTNGKSNGQKPKRNKTGVHVFNLLQDQTNQDDNSKSKEKVNPTIQPLSNLSPQHEESNPISKRQKRKLAKKDLDNSAPVTPSSIDKSTAERSNIIPSNDEAHQNSSTAKHFQPEDSQSSKTHTAEVHNLDPMEGPTNQDDNCKSKEEVNHKIQSLSMNDASSQHEESKPLSKRKKRKLAKKDLDNAAPDTPPAIANSTTDNNSNNRTTDKVRQHSSFLKERRLKNGVIVKDLSLGRGAAVQSGRKVSMDYKIRFPDGTMLDQMKLQFRVGTGQVVRGLEEGIVGMRVGGERAIVVPPELAYGAQGSGKRIPPHATLHFTVTLLSVGVSKLS